MTNAPSSPAKATMYVSASPSANRTSRSGVERRVERTVVYPSGGAMRVSASIRGVARAALEVRKKRMDLFTQCSCRREMTVGYLRMGEGPDSLGMCMAKRNEYRSYYYYSGVTGHEWGGRTIEYKSGSDADTHPSAKHTLHMSRQSGVFSSVHPWLASGTIQCIQQPFKKYTCEGVTL